MSEVRNAIELLALLLEYPTCDIREDAELLVKSFEHAPGDALLHVRAFRDGMARMTQDNQEELYTRTFDISPLCSLEIGWQLYGESYDRGGFLVKMKVALAEQGVAPTSELADHLPQMLRLFARVEPAKMRELAVAFLEPALIKMTDAFGESENPYLSLLRATNALIVELAKGIKEEENHV